MKFKITLLSLLTTASVAQADFRVNVGGQDSSFNAGQGPQGANTDYLGYATAHEASTSGAKVTYNNISFSEGGLAGTYNVGVEFSWPDADDDTAKQSFTRSNIQGYPDFWSSWVGIDSRSATTGELTMTLSGLEANQDFVLTSYHGDTHDQSGTFTVNQTITGSETATSPFDFARLNQNGTLTPWTTNAYSFDVTTDGSGNLSVTYTNASEIWTGINGFDLVAIPEPGSYGLIAGMLGLTSIALRRRRS